MKRTIKKVLNCLMVLLLALSVFARNATIVSAADSTKGIEITVDRTELDNAIQAAKMLVYLFKKIRMSTME